MKTFLIVYSIIGLLFSIGYLFLVYFDKPSGHLDKYDYGTALIIFFCWPFTVISIIVEIVKEWKFEKKG